jgi:replicative DNA helicase
MILYDDKLESQTLFNCLESSSKVCSQILARITPDHFYDKVNQRVYKHISRVLHRTGRSITWDEVCFSPELPESIKKELRLLPVKKLKDSSALRMLEDLDKYRKMRVIYNSVSRSLRSLESESLDVDDLLHELNESLGKARSASVGEIINVGYKDNSLSIVEDLLSNKRRELIRTGFNAFDSKNGGFLLGSLVIIAGPTGGGKTAMANQLAINMAIRGSKVTIVPLEMTKRESIARVVSNVAKINVKKFLYTKTTQREKRHAMQCYQKFVKDCSRLRGVLRVYEPEMDVTIEDILTILKPYNDDVIIIDYIGLLKGVDGDQSWQALGNAARYAKVWAKNNNKIVIVLAQLSDEGAIRYSKAIKDHANNMFAWTYTDQNKKSGIIDIIQQKARNQEAFDFQLQVDFSTMRMFDVEQTDFPELNRSERGAKRLRRCF